MSAQALSQPTSTSSSTSVDAAGITSPGGDPKQNLRPLTVPETLPATHPGTLPPATPASSEVVQRLPQRWSHCVPRARIRPKGGRLWPCLGCRECTLAKIGQHVRVSTQSGRSGPSPPKSINSETWPQQGQRGPKCSKGWPTLGLYSGTRSNFGTPWRATSALAGPLQGAKRQECGRRGRAAMCNSRPPRRVRTRRTCRPYGRRGARSMLRWRAGMEVIEICRSGLCRAPSAELLRLQAGHAWGAMCTVNTSTAEAAWVGRCRLRGGAAGLGMRPAPQRAETRRRRGAKRLGRRAFGLAATTCTDVDTVAVTDASCTTLLIPAHRRRRCGPMCDREGLAMHRRPLLGRRRRLKSPARPRALFVRSPGRQSSWGGGRWAAATGCAAASDGFIDPRGCGGRTGSGGRMAEAAGLRRPHVLRHPTRLMLRCHGLRLPSGSRWGRANPCNRRSPRNCHGA